jgi:hypothetical protein
MITVEELQKRIAKAKTGAVDLTSEEDMALCVMNLIAIEEHLFFTHEKTGKGEYLDSLKAIREIRKNLMAKMIPQYEGETWCTCKHLLSATMRLFEVGTKLLGQGEKEEAKEYFDKAYRLFNIFWAIRLKLITLPELNDLAKEEKAKSEPWTLDDIMKKMVDCCDE